MLFVWIFLALILFIVILMFVLKISKKFKPKNRIKKEKKPKIKKAKIITNNNAVEVQGSYVDLVDKFLFRKEVKLLVLISKILPKGYVIFPKISLGSILEPVGRKNLFISVQNKILDFVIFEESTMKPALAVDVYDGTIGDEQLNQTDDIAIQALNSANLPLVSFKVKTDYTEEEIKTPIYDALGLNKEKEEEKGEE